MIGAILGGVAGLFGARGASKAAKAQKNTANQQIAEARRVDERTQAQLTPYRAMGDAARDPYLYNMGLAPRPQNYVDFTGTPGYNFRFGEGMNAIQSLASARGSLHSGRTMEAANRFGQGIASDEYGNYMNRLRDLIGVGQNATVQAADSGYNGLQGVMGGLANYGNAAASGAIGTANALTQGIGNIFGAYQYQQGLTGQTGTPFRPMPNPFRPRG